MREGHWEPKRFPITIARIHGRTIRGITERRNLLIHNDFIKNNINIENLAFKYHISDLECFSILQKFQEKEIKKNNKSNISDNDSQTKILENINNNLIEIRDLLKSLTINQNNIMIPNNNSNNPFDEL